MQQLFLDVIFFGMVLLYMKLVQRHVVSVMRFLDVQMKRHVTTMCSQMKMMIVVFMLKI